MCNEKNINLLVLSCGSRIKIVEYFKRTLSDDDCIVGADCSVLAPALCVSDDKAIIPRIDDENYLESVMEVCNEKNINAVISLFDKELNVISKNKDKFLENSVFPIVSDFYDIDLCFNKYDFINHLKNIGLNHIISFIDIEEFKNSYLNEEIQFPVFFKPNSGSASINIKKIDSLKELEIECANCNNYLIQEYIDGKEFGVDVYVDFISKEPVDIFIKEKVRMRAGETDKSVSVINYEIVDEIKKLLKTVNLVGPLDIDVFEKNGSYYISEINPRFGGGYPHAYESGINFMKNIYCNLKGKQNESFTELKYDEGIYMMKYSEVIVRKDLFAD